jgi:hypothetical protein
MGRDDDAYISPMISKQVRGQSDRASWGLRVVRTRNPIPLPQRLRLLGAAKRIERSDTDARAVLGPSVVSSEDLVRGGEGGLAEGERFSRKSAANQ